MSWLAALCLATVVVPTAPGLPASQGNPTWSVRVTVQTVPALAGVPFMFDRYTALTDDRGRAVFTAPHDFGRHSLTLVTTVVNRSDRRFSFAVWSGQRDPEQAYRPTVTGLPLRADYTVTAAFQAEYLAKVGFVDQDGQPIEPGLITAATVRGETGAAVDLPTNGQPLWLVGSRPVSRANALVLADSCYSVQSVLVAGTNAIDAGRQRFCPAEQAVTTVTVPLLALTVSVRLPPWHASGSAIVMGPNGLRHEVVLGGDGVVRLTRLPHGLYTVDAVVPGAVVLPRQVALSRDATVDIHVVGWHEIGFVAAGLVIVAAGFLTLGLIRKRRRVDAAAADEA